MKSRREMLLERKKALLEQEQSNKGWRGVGKDIAKGAKEVYPALAEMFSNLPSEAFGAGKQLLTNPDRAGRNIIGGSAQGIHGLLSTPGNIRDYLVEKEIVSPKTPSYRLPESWMPKEFNANEAVKLPGHQPGDQLLQGLTSSLPYVAGGELGALGVPARMAARSGAQGAFAAGQNQNPVTASLMVPAIEAPLRGIGSAYNSIHPRNSLRGSLSPEELQANVRAAEGTNTPLGSIVASPTLKQIFENVTTKWPGSGSDELLARIGNQVENRAEGLLEQSGEGLAPGERNAQLKAALENAYETQRQRKNELYRPVTELSEAEGYAPQFPTFTERAVAHLQQMENSPLLHFDTDFRKSYNKIANLGEGNPTILDANLVSGKLHEEGTRLKNNRQASASDRAIGNLYLDLSNRIRNDLRNDLRNRASPELNRAFNEANQNYRENFSQFLDQDIYRLAQPEVEAETIVNDIIKPGKKGDKFLRIEKIQNALPPEQRNILGNAWLRNALDKEGTLNAKQFAQMIDKLGQRQFEALFPDPVYRQQLLDYGRLRGMNEKALSRMANPMTGQQLAAPGMIGVQIGAVANAIATGNLPLAALYGFGPQIGSRIMNHILTDPAIRERFVNSMINPQNNQRTRLGGVPALASQANQQPFMRTENYDIYE